MFFPLIDVIRYSHIAFKENLQRESKSRCLNGLLTANQRKRKKYHQLSKVRQDLTVNRQNNLFLTNNRQRDPHWDTLYRPI